MSALPETLAQHVLAGTTIPAHPLAITQDHQLDERYQRALTRYYCAAGVGGLAVGVHTTQFEIHDPQVGLLGPVLELASQTIDEMLQVAPRPFIKVAGVIGRTEQAIREAELALRYGYHAGLLSVAALKTATDDELLEHCRRVAEVIPLFGFYLQPAVGGRVLGYNFWRRFVEIPNVVAIKVAPFDRYKTLDVVRAVADAKRGQEIALYTGNDDNIVADLITDFPVANTQAAAETPLRFVGGLLGHWAVWTHAVVKMHAAIQAERQQGTIDYAQWLAYGVQVTDANAAFFDPAHAFHGCITGIHEVLRRQGLMQGNWSLNPNESLSPGQIEEIDRVYRAYPQLHDDAFVAEHLDQWLR
ncbi:MAG: dihydrodipicolinate synthase family protein [Caldilineaceae bacterium]|nr:dihydrodipicolinate synthase family protein [Caldilineaceae bacterium]